jgi:AcrR family transcriptional regulator
MTRSAEILKHEAASAAGVRMAGGERRQQILEVAMRLFSQRGFRGTTTKEIAAVAGVSEAMVFRHFATKEELYSAILDFKACSGGIEDLRAHVADAIRRKDDFAVFSGFARELMRHHESDTEFLRLLTHSALEGHELAEMFWDRNVRGLYEFLGGYVRDRQREGAMRDVDPRIVVRAFVGAVIHHSLNNTLWDTKRSLLDISNERAAEEFARIILEGVKTRERVADKPKRAAAVSSRKKTKKRSGDK